MPADLTAGPMPPSADAMAPAPLAAPLLDRLKTLTHAILPSEELALHQEQGRHFLVARPRPPVTDETLAHALAAAFHRLREV
jgi:hypothetical protein